MFAGKRKNDTTPAEVKKFAFKDYWEVLCKRRRIIVAFTVITVGLVIFYDFTRPKLYESTVTIRIPKPAPRIISGGLLKSYSLAERIIEKLGLVTDHEIGHAQNPTAELLSWVSVNPQRLSNLVGVSVKGKDPLKITSIANAWVREFISQEPDVSRIRIVDPASVPRVPVWPRPVRDIALALLASLCLSLWLCIFLECLDSTLKTSDDVEFYAKLPFLGYIPELKKEGGTESAAATFNNLKAAILFSFPEDKPLRTTVVTSAIPQEGKSFISANLAISFAQSGDSTLLIDADMRKGKLAKNFNYRTETGLSSLLMGVISLENVIAPTVVPNLFFIGCGPYAPNPVELLGSATLKEALQQLQKKYKRIIIDSTPILSVSEAVLLGDSCDGLIFVIRAGYTSLKYITAARKILAMKARIIGAVLNAA